MDEGTVDSHVWWEDRSYSFGQSSCPSYELQTVRCSPLPRGLWLEVINNSDFCVLWALGRCGSPGRAQPDLKHTPMAPLPRNWFAHLYLCLFFNLSVGLQCFCRVWDLLCWGGCLRRGVSFPLIAPIPSVSSVETQPGSLDLQPRKEPSPGLCDAFCSSCIFDLLNIFLVKFCIRLAHGKPPPSH